MLIRCIAGARFYFEKVSDRQARDFPLVNVASAMRIVERDARATHTALQLVLAQSAISSQLIDNLNAWVHLRALLTDLFVIDELIRSSER